MEQGALNHGMDEPAWLASAGLGGMAPSPFPCFVWAQDGRLAWANPAAVVFWAARDMAALQGLDWQTFPIWAAIRPLFRSLAPDTVRLERLPLMPFGRLRPLTARVRRLTLEDGSRGLAIISTEAVLKRVNFAPSAPARPISPPAPIAPVDSKIATEGPPPAVETEILPSAAEAESGDEAVEAAARLAAEQAEASEFEAGLPDVAALESIDNQPVEQEDAASFDKQAAPIGALEADADSLESAFAQELQRQVEAEEPIAASADGALIQSAEEAALPSAVPSDAASSLEASGGQEHASQEEAGINHPLPSPPQWAPLSPRAQLLAERGDIPLRFVWETDDKGILTYVSRALVSALGADALPHDEEGFAAFATRLGMDGSTALHSALASRDPWSELKLQWPIADGAEKLDVELSAAPADGGGFRGFGVVRAIVPAPLAPIAEVEEIIAPAAVDEIEAEKDAPASDAMAASASEDSLTAATPPEPQEAALQDREAAVDVPTASETPVPVETSAPSEVPAPAAPSAELPVSNVVNFPSGSASSAAERRLEPSESAALRTIARVLGGPIGLPRASINDLANFVVAPASDNQQAEATKPESPDDVGIAVEMAPTAPQQEATQSELPLEQASPPQADIPAGPDDASALPEPPDFSEIAPPPAQPAAFGDDPAYFLREARLREAELRAILDTATDGVVTLTGQGLILALNRSAEALFGVETDEVRSQPFTRLLAPASHRIVNDYLEGLSRNGVASLLNDGREVLALERKGGLIPLFMTIGRVSLASDDNKYCAVLRDLTQWKAAEERLVAAKREAETASHQKSDFLAKISHELRTPLNAIIGFTEVIMQERFGPIGNDRYRSYVSDIHGAGTHILGLVNDLLDLAKIEAGKIELSFAAVKLGDIVQQTVSTMQAQANRQGVILRSSVPKVPPVVADVRSLRQILFNLVSNGIKYTKRGGQVIVSTGLTDEGEVMIKVRDSGLGMSASEIETALKPFGRVEIAGSSGVAEGTGLGLPLTKALAEANRASFHIDSTVGVGTLVQITFPSTRVLAE